ncbi:hypothetical protein I0E51_03960 [Pseudomonas lalucatii]|nr:hypothetical protein [Pseudomonas lalucatii]
MRGCLALPLLRRVPLFDAWPSPITFSCFFTITIGASALPRSAVGNLGPASRRETSPACRQRQALLSQAIVLGHLKIFAVPARATPAPWKH